MSQLNKFYWAHSGSGYNICLKNNTFISINNNTLNFSGITVDSTRDASLYIDNQSGGSIKTLTKFNPGRLTASQLYLRSFIHIFWIFTKKLRFTGKGYKIKKNILKQFKFYFGYSHPTFLLTEKIKLKKLTKYKLCIISNFYWKFLLLKNFLKKIRHINKFTKRGLRFTKQFVFKRPGKQSTYY